MDEAPDRAASAIRELIVSRPYRPGDRLPSERDLAGELRMSRPTLREGLRRLRGGGVLETRRGSGTYLADVDVDGVYEIRLRLEPLAAERAARHRTQAQAKAMERAVASMRRHAGDPEAFNRSDARFHALVAEASASSALLQTLTQIAELALLTRTVVAPSEASRMAALADVERVLSAVRDQHPKRAAAAMKRHIVRVSADYARIVAVAPDRDVTGRAE